MPRIRKKTSKRGTTNQREKIKHKVSESRKKQKKAERKAKVSGKPLPNKKSKKDPGIPNNFPYKDQILAEVAEQRRIAAEEKQRRKDEKRDKLLAAKALGDPADESGAEDGEEGDDGDESMDDDDLPTKDGKGFDGIMSIRPGPSTSNAVTAATKATAIVAPPTPVIPTTPGPPTLREVLDVADVVLHVVDVRDPAAGVCTSIMGAMKEKSKSEGESEAEVKGKSKKKKAKGVKESKVEGKDVLLILNKIDAVPRESADSWLQHFRSSPPTGVAATLPFRAASAFLPVSPSALASAVKAKNIPKPKMNDALGTDAIWTFLREKAARLKKDKAEEGKEMVVAVVGVTNSGKTALINSLACNSVSTIYTPSITTATKGKKEHTKPYTTTTALEVVLDLPGGVGKVRIVDTPGVEFVRDVQEDDEGDVDGMEEEESKEKEKIQEARARDILLRNRGKIEKLKDPLFAVNHVVSRADTQDLMLAYSLPAFTNGDATAFLAGLARVNGLIKKRGLLDHAGAARIILRDWSSGRFARYTVPPSSSSAPLPSGAMSALYEKDETTLSTMRTRKEMRKGEGVMLVKMIPGDVDSRDIVFDEVWAEDEESEDEESEGGDDEDDNNDDEEDEEHGEVEEDDDDEEAPPLLEPTPTPKRKRAVSFAAAPPAYSKRRAPKKAKSHK